MNGYSSRKTRKRKRANVELEEFQSNLYVAMKNLENSLRKKMASA